MLAVKRLVDVVPEVDLRECTLHSLLQKGYQWPQNRTCECVPQKRFKFFLLVSRFTLLHKENPEHYDVIR